MTENADLQSRVVELQSRHQVKKGLCVVFVNVVSLISVLQSVVQTKDRELVEAHQQLRQKVNS